MSDEQIAPPVLKREGTEYIFHWETQELKAIVRDVTSGRDGPRAAVEVRDALSGALLHAAMLNLLSTSGRQTFVKELLAADPGNNWRILTQQFCYLAVEAYREGDPMTLLEPRRRPASGQFAVRPLLPIGQTTIWFGDGKSGKSYLALAACRAMMLGGALAGMEAQPMAVAYLDWEADEAEHADRLLRLGGDVTIFYRQCAAPFVQQASRIKRDLDRQQIEFVVIDSLGLACGADINQAEPVLQFFSALRSLGRTALVIHPVPKEKRDQLFGSIYVRNSARSAWLVVRSSLPEPAGFSAGLHHKATNTGPLERARAVRFTFDEDAYTTEVEPTDRAAVPELAEGMSAASRILGLLASSGRQMLADVAEALDMPETTARARLNELRQARRTEHFEDGTWGLLSDR